ncbi:type I-F CRISPR-associated helicase Cas3 [Burkholderia plantarii]|uniref:type I-F CRISPR-associated helicase Cas3f n=1 Tax=Burkholderia plantarii TaxID=41899 RepID=UPI00272C7146|nr:type I-F CRISPR-associated helicase Cas3f [Burkholderia plantarii]WLE59238.1 type I-F CRISPR-associated helicase Cas3 [Burkholderia plantarii]
MNVLFVSQCTKRALTETRRILDQFAERRGDRTWQTPITQAGLDTVRKLLRQTARKNTAVACHWIRGRDHSELLWIVGDGRQFNRQGAVPTNSSTSDVLRADDESHWHRLPLISGITALAALMHDLGKATLAFQNKLTAQRGAPRSDYRHEWVSVRLFQAFVGEAANDADWLARLAACADPAMDPSSFELQWLDHEGGRLLRDGRDAQAMARLPFAVLPPVAQAVAWLILTHHRLPCKPVRNEASNPEDDDRRFHWRRFGTRTRDISAGELRHLFRCIDPDWNAPREPSPPHELDADWEFPHGLPVITSAWRKQAARHAGKLQAAASEAVASHPLDDPFVMHVSRMCLMLADHHYSSLTDETLRRPYRNERYPLYANTLRNRDGGPACDERGRSRFNQTLDEHLLGVQAHASLVTHSLPTLARSLPALQNHAGLRKRSRNARFQWQDKATDLAAGIRARAQEHGAFIVNMASTGSGKTLGNARIMNALSDPQRGMRCAFAIGLRTLTLQTGRSFRRDLGLNDEQLAIQVGGAVSRMLFDYREAQAEASGSASTQALLDEGGQILFDGDDRHALLQRVTSDAKVRALIAAPLLVCTVDHLMPATESLRGGHQIAPTLRLMTGDLVLDEPDDFDIDDILALTRLVHWAGMLGSRVLLSSATLPPALVQGLYLAYRDGRGYFQRNRGARLDAPLSVACLWVDEFAQSHADCGDGDAFKSAHDAFVDRRCERLAGAEVRRKARLVSIDRAWSSMEKLARREAMSRLLLDEAWQLHRDPQNHGIDPASGKRVSLGLIRMSNIDPLFDVALAMYRHGAPAPDVRVHLCVYHSQFPLLARSDVEAQLDAAFDRRSASGGTDPLWTNPAIRALLDRHDERDHLFVVLASPVCEVGRDWDADWAIAEPSAVRSLIQLAGRVRRHRAGAVAAPNLAVLETNLRCFERRGKDDPVFAKPGFEMRKMVTHGKSGDTQAMFHLESHSLDDLLDWDESGRTWCVDSRPRIRKAAKLNPRRRLADLEHGRMWDTMLARDTDSQWRTPITRDATRHWHDRDADARHVWLTGVLPQIQPFRFDPQTRVEVVWLPNEDEDALRLYRIEEEKGAPARFIDDRDMVSRVVPDVELAGPGISPWCHTDLLALLRQWAEAHGQSLLDAARQVAVVSLPKQDAGWRYHPALGFSRD